MKRWQSREQYDQVRLKYYANPEHCWCGEVIGWAAAMRGIMSCCHQHGILWQRWKAYGIKPRDPKRARDKETYARAMARRDALRARLDLV